MSLLIDVLTVATTKHKNIMISISQFTDLLQSDHSFNIFQPITDRKVLQTGWYGSINGCKLYCSYIVSPENFRYSDTATPNSKNEADWSAEITYEQWAKDNAGLMTLIR